MFHKLKKGILNGLSFLIAMIAFSGVEANSMWFLYEPVVPKSLKGK